MDLSFYLSLLAAAIGFFWLFRILFHHDSKEDHSSTSSLPSSLSPPPSSLPRIWKHNVFPSFRGTDVRKTILSHILKEFRSKGIVPFIDNDIDKSKSIGPELLEAIKASKIAIVLLSKNYASSSWCLNELVEIMKCREELGQTVMTIFYEVDPTDVKKQTGDFGKEFTKTCQGKSKDNIGRWKQALAEVATIAGEHSRNWIDEATMIEKITIDISNKLNMATPSRDFDNLIGMGAHMKRMKLLLRLDLEDEVRMIGIWGPAGIGKTTIARFMCDQLSSSFQLSAILVNIKGCYPRPCFDEYNAQLKLQNQMLSQIFNQKDIVVPHLGVAQERLKDQKIFLVLDDVDRLGQLAALAKKTSWFGPGSRIIITTEDLRILKAHKIPHIYKVDFPTTEEALQIFCMNAFGQKFPKYGFEMLASEVTYLAGNLPLGLRVMGSYFRGMSKQEWTNALPKLRTRLDGEIQSILEFSYDALDDEDKNLFLHLACFFDYVEITKVEEYLAKKFLDVRQGLNVLADKSLISITDSGQMVIVHNLLAHLGRDIVCKQSVREPGQRQFLVDRRDICEVLADDAAGSRSVIGIDFYFYGMKDKLNISERAFERMTNLQFLRFDGNDRGTLQQSGSLDYLTGKLRLLDWPDFPMKCLPSNVNLEFLVELNMRSSKLEKLWEGIKPLPNLRWMDLSVSRKLKELPDLSTATNLQKLDLKSCSSLTNLPSSIGKATKLEQLDLGWCLNLVEIPFSIGDATNLKNLSLFACSSLKELPSSIGNITHLTELDLTECSSLVELPSSIGNLRKLSKLILQGCSSLMELPSSIGNLHKLWELNLKGCSNLMKIPFSIQNVSECDFEGCSSLLELPSFIGNTSHLKKLNLRGCSSLVDLPFSIGNATMLEKLNLSECSNLMELPFSLGNATMLMELNLNNCSSLVELPSSIGNLHNLLELYMPGCSKIEALPININLESLNSLVLTDCSLMKSFPEISTNIKYLCLIGTAIKEVPSTIRSWSHLDGFGMSYSENLGEFPHVFDTITVLDLSNTEIEEIPPLIKRFSRLCELVLTGC